jgi:hypothetical protein
MAIGARGKALAGQTAGKGNQLPLPGGRLEVHQRAHREIPSADAAGRRRRANDYICSGRSP